MIGRLRGQLLEKHAPALLLDVGGVGYELEAPMSTFFDLPDIGLDVVLHVHMVVREDAQQLFGFLTLAERSLFRKLIKVSGVGARLALAVLSGMNVAAFQQCLRDGDVAALVRVPGIGKKTAERLIVEMRDKVSDEALGAPAVPGGPVAHTPNASDDAISALVALGYKAADATKLVCGLDGATMTSEEMIREALKGAMR